MGCADSDGPGHAPRYLYVRPQLTYSHIKVIEYLKSIDAKCVVKRHHNVAKGQVETYFIRFENDKYIGEIVFWEWGNLSFTLGDLQSRKVTTVDPFPIEGDNYKFEIQKFITENSFV